MSLSDTKIVLSGGAFDINLDFSKDLSLRVAGGTLITPYGFRVAPNATLALVASSTNYVEVTDAGVIQVVATDFTDGNTNLYEIATSATRNSSK